MEVILRPSQPAKYKENIGLVRRQNGEGKDRDANVARAQTESQKSNYLAD
jgi:hypothetical protein